MNAGRAMKSYGAVLILIGAVAAAPSIAQRERSDVASPVKESVPFPTVPGGGGPNDDCASAVVIASLPFNHTQSTVGATTEPGEPLATCTTDGASVWFTYTYTGIYQAIATATTTGSDFDTVLEAFTGACGASTSIACNDDSIGLQSSIIFVVDPGVTYLIKASGFGGDTGNLNFDFNVAGSSGVCPPLGISGTLGSGSPDWPSVSGTQTGRLNRNGVSSTCAAPKVCNPFDATPGRAFDAYTISNDSGAPQCVSVVLDVITQTACNLQVNAYLNTYDPNNVCANYLADPGLSSATPPTPTLMGYVIPAASDMVLSVHTTNPGEIGCLYDLVVVGDVCQPCTVVAPADVSVGNDAGQCGAIVNYTAPSTTGACGTVTCTPPAGSLFPVGTTVVTCTDTGGASDSFNVTVNDTEAPVVIAPALAVGTDAGLCTAVVNFVPGGTDNCQGAGPVTCVPPSGSTFPLGGTAVNCSMTDAANNVGNGAGNITVFDDEAPLISCPADITESLPPGAVQGAVNWTDPVVSDNCPLGAPVCVPPSGSTFQADTTTPVNCTITDTGATSATCSFTVTLGLVSILEIPTLSMSGIASLLLVLAATGFLALRRRRANR